MLKAPRAFAVYLSFNGNCREAFNYYQLCFGGELHLQMLPEPTTTNLNTCSIQHIVLSATLTNNFFKLVGTDLTDVDKIVPGNQVSILVECSVQERVRLINKLLGRNYCHLKDLRPFIHITDMYSIRWILHAK